MSDDYDDDYNYDTEGGREDTKNSSTTDARTGKLEENSFENGKYTGVTGKRLESNKNVVQNKRPRCEAPHHRKYAPAIFTLEFSGHPKYGTKKVDLCQTCWEQEKHNPENFIEIAPIKGDSKSLKTARADSAIRRLVARDRSVRAASTFAGALTERVATPGRPTVSQTSGSIDEDIKETYTKPKNGKKANKAQSAASDPVTPVIDTAKKSGGRVPKMGDPDFDWSSMEEAASAQFNANKNRVSGYIESSDEARDAEDDWEKEEDKDAEED